MENLNKQEAENKPSERKLTEIAESEKRSGGEFKEFLGQQTSLPKEKWSQDFKDYVKEKAREAEQLGKESPECSPEEERNLTYDRYLKVLDLDEEKLKNKRILDMGCGEEGDFVKKCLDDEITQEIYGLDLDIKPEAFENKYKKHFFKGDIGETFPAENFDYITAIGVPMVPPVEDKKAEHFAEKTLNNALAALNENGELRIYPVMKAPPGSEMPGIEFSRKKWLEILEKMSAEKKIDWELIPIDISVSGKNKDDVWLNEVLVIKKADEAKKYGLAEEINKIPLYEPFDPEKEVEKIGKFTNEELKNLTPQERLKTKEERLKIFKEKLAEQKSGIAKINAELESMIFDGADEVDIKKLQDYMQEKSAECKLSVSQMFKYNAAFNEIQERNNAIGRVADKYSGKSGKELFAAMFGWQPQGEVQIKRGPLSFFVICRDSNDYVALYTKSSGKGAALSTDGFAGARTIIPELEDTINVAKAVGNSEARLEIVRVHEEKHIFDDLMERVKSKEENIKLTKGEVAKSQRQELRELVNRDTVRFERTAKKEMFAYLVSGESSDTIKKLLLKRESEGGMYDYFELYNKYYSFPDYARFSEFRNKYEQDVSRALDIVARLEELGFTRDKIIGLLQTERLDQWDKVYKRFALCQEFKSKKEEYIRRLDEGIKNATSELEKRRKQNFEGDDELMIEIERDISQLLDRKKEIEEIEILKH